MEDRFVHIDGESQAPKKRQGDVYQQVHLVFAGRHQEDVVEVDDYSEPQLTQRSHDRPRDFGKGARCCGEAKRETAKLIQLAVKSELEKAAVVAVHRDVKVGVLEVDLA